MRRLLAKRLERGVFHFPEPGKDAAMELEPAELAVLPGGSRLGKRRPIEKLRPALALR